MEINKQLLYIEWSDTVSPSNMEAPWWNLEEAKRWAKEDDYWVSECGFLIEETKNYILIATRHNSTKSKSEVINSIGGLTKIPKPWIRKRKTIKVA